MLQSAKPVTAQVRQGIAREYRTPSWFCLTTALPGTIRSAGKQSAPREISSQALSGVPNKSASYAGYAVTGNEFNAPINSVEGDQGTALIQAGVLTRTISGSRTFTPLHDTSSAEWLMEDAIPQETPEEYFENLGQVPATSVSFSEGAESIRTGTARSLIPTGSSSSGTFDSNTNSVSGCTSG